MKRHIYDIAEGKFVVTEDDETKWLRSAEYNYNFNKKTGLFFRWGKVKEDDPSFCPLGPEILDIEISVNGCPNACPFCYKNNKNTEPTNMTFETFKTVIDKFPKHLSQVAFGITGVQTNPDFVKMLEYTRGLGIIPNFTLSGIDLTDDITKDIVEFIGGLAVSAYETDKNICYNTVQAFTNRGIKQTNIHLMASEETLPFIYEVLNDRLTDPRLADMNAIIFLGVKPKGRAKDNYTPLSQAAFTDMLDFCMEKKIDIGFDSCTAPKYETAVRDMSISQDMKKRMIEYSESCESTLFSMYVNVLGQFFPCSFTEEGEGVSLVEADDFQDCWRSDKAEEFRKRLLATTKDGCRSCPAFDIGGAK